MYGTRLQWAAALWAALLFVVSRGVACGDDPTFAARVRPVLERHCVACHRGDEAEGELQLDRLATDLADLEARHAWQTVLRRVESGEMPPKDKPRPTADELRTLTSAINNELTRVELARRVKDGRVTLRRLNRIEYQNTIRDLLGVDVDLIAQLPADGSADGFDNAGAALHTSSFLMERYLEAADKALNEAICNRPDPPKQYGGRFDFKKARPINTTTESVYRILDDTVVCFCSSAWHNVFLPNFYPQDGGDYRVRLAVSAYQSAGKPVTFRVMAGTTRLSGDDGLVGYFDAPPDEQRIVEFVRHFEPKESVSILPYALPSAQTVKNIGAETYEGPGLAIHWAEVEGPLHENWPPASHRRLFGDLPRKSAPGYNDGKRVEVTSEQPLVDAERILRDFTSRAFRRPATADEVRPFVDVVAAKLAAEYTFEQAMRAALKGVLISPEFIFLREKPGRLDDNALASRLSYFLWSTMPDDELLDLARHNKLGRPDELRRQVERMLGDPKAAAFTENFVGQWLGLREIDFTEPSHILYSEFDHMLKVSMMRETELFFDELLRHDLSLTNFVDSDFTMLNGRLAKHYGIDGVDGWDFQKVTLPKKSHRGGVLTMGSVMKVTANGTTTSPVMRGTWVLDRILGTPAPPPPDEVPAIEPDIRGATTIRELLEKHRSDAACASCHVKIDPPGFALESFDCIGGYREAYRVTGGRAATVNGEKMRWGYGKPVDPSGVTEEGRAFANVDEFKQVLLADKERLARALASKLTTYATGAAPTTVDRPAIDAIVAAVAKKNYGLRSLVHEVVQSELFQNK